MEGVVLKSTGGRYTVKAGNTVYECTLKGRLRLEGRKTTNPIAAGDKVGLEFNNGEPVISRIHPRRNYIIRKSLNLSKQTQILASNLDQAILFVTLAVPRTSTGFIDRFLVTAEAYSVPAKIIFNKTDLLEKEMLAVLDEVMAIYKHIGYPCYKLSALDIKQVQKIKTVFKNKTTLLAGHSGTGKSTFINALEPALDLKTGEVSITHLKGMHTTTFTELHPLSFGGYVIDSPGIKELGLVEMKREELGHYFPEIRERMNDCKFNNCLHVNEPGCAVMEAVENGEISEERYSNYLGMLNSEEMEWKKWEAK
jgi:ribosome biogenesis GTPase